MGGLELLVRHGNWIHIFPRSRMEFAKYIYSIGWWIDYLLFIFLYFSVTTTAAVIAINSAYRTPRQHERNTFQWEI